MHRDADRAGVGFTGTGRIRMDMPSFQPGHHQGHKDAAQRDETLQRAGRHLAFADHVYEH